MGRRFSKHLVEKKNQPVAICLLVSLQSGREHPQNCSLILQEHKVPKTILKKESTRESLLIQHSAHIYKNSPCLLNNSWLPVNFEQERL